MQTPFDDFRDADTVRMYLWLRYQRRNENQILINEVLNFDPRTVKGTTHLTQNSRHNNRAILKVINH